MKWQLSNQIYYCIKVIFSFFRFDVGKMAGQSVVTSNSQSLLKILYYQQDQTGRERSARSTPGRSKGRPVGSQGVEG